MRIKVNPGAQVQRGGATYTEGEELEVSAEDGRRYIKDGFATEVGFDATKKKK